MLGAPTLPLTDGTVSLRVPSAEDVVTLEEYAAMPDGLEGGWLPIEPGASPSHLAWVVEDWLRGWAGAESHNGPALLLDVPGAPRFVGHVGMRAGEPGLVRLVYGIAPHWRRGGLATRVTTLATAWLIQERGACVVELQIAAGHKASRRVAEKAGFRLAGTVQQHVPGTGATHEDLRYTFDAGA